jgi:hypothetical protein
MKLVADESTTALLALLGSAIGTIVLTVGGAMTEQAALHNLMTGHLVLGAWEAWMGALALVAGLYLLGYREFWSRLVRLRRMR